MESDLTPFGVTDEEVDRMLREGQAKDMALFREVFPLSLLATMIRLEVSLEELPADAKSVLYENLWKLYD
jgi:hypothetical protein